MSGTGTTKDTAADTGVATKKYQAVVEIDDGVITVTGELPSSYMLAGNRGHRVYNAVDNGQGPLQSVILTKDQRNQLPAHTGLKYRLVIEPILADEQ